MLYELITYAILPALGVASVLVLVRLIRGPSLPDRVVALDLFATLIIGVAAVYAVATDRSAFLDIAVIVALIAFLGTVAFAYYLQRGRQ